MRQIPAQDFDPQYCHDLDEFEKNELKCFRFLVQEEAIGKGITKFNNFEHDIVSFYLYINILFGRNFFKAHKESVKLS